MASNKLFPAAPNRLVPDTLEDGAPDPDATAGLTQLYRSWQARGADMPPLMEWLRGAGSEYANALLMGSTSPVSRVRPWFGDARHLSEIAEMISASPFKHHGLRVMTEKPTGEPVTAAPGDQLQPSFKWNDGEPTNKPLSGTSSVGISSAEDIADAIKKLGPYWGEQIVLVGGNKARSGADPGEKIISNAQALEVWNRQKAGVGRYFYSGRENPGHVDYEAMPELGVAESAVRD